MKTLAGKRQGPPTEDILFPIEASAQKQLQRAVKEGRMTRIAKGIYANAIAPPDAPLDDTNPVVLVVRRNWQKILGRIVPGAVVSHLSALLGGMTGHGEITLSHPTRFNTSLALPGLTVVLLKGAGPLPGDMPLWDTGLYWSSRPRSLLENLGKTRGAKPRTAGREGVERKLIDILHVAGEGELNRIRDNAREIAPGLGMQRPFETLDHMIGALLGTHAQGTLTTAAGVRVSQGTPMDAARLTRFARLADHLRVTPLPALPDLAAHDPAKTHFAFLESYFSNYVEGTRFSIEEAEGIVLHNRIVATRPKDCHDILGVFNLALHPHYRSAPPPPTEIIDSLRERHRLMLANRPEVDPGEFKTKTNFAGQTQFVEPRFVRGTLLEGVKLAISLPEGLARAIYYAFLVSEIHPFSDGNGRISRLVMNAELSRLGLCRIVIPTLFHEQYVDAQRALSRGDDPAPLARALRRIAEWTTQFDYTDLKTVVDAMTKANAFQEDAREFRLLGRDGQVFA